MSSTGFGFAVQSSKKGNFNFQSDFFLIKNVSKKFEVNFLICKNIKIGHFIQVTYYLSPWCGSHGCKQ